MSDTLSHKIEAKFNNGLIGLKDIPINIRKKWNRHNFEVGYFRYLRNKKRYLLAIICLILFSCNPCRNIEKYKICFPADTVKITDIQVHHDTQTITVDSIVYDTIKGETQLIEKTVYLTKYRQKTDTIYSDKVIDRLNPINEELKANNEKLTVNNQVLKKQRNRLLFSLSGLIALVVIYFLIRKYLFKI